MFSDVIYFYRPPTNVTRSNPPLPPRQNAGKQKKGSKDGDDFDEEPLFPKYENIFHFAPKEKKTSPPSTNNAPEGKLPFQSSSVVAGSKAQVELDTKLADNQEDVHRLRLADLVQ